MRIGPRGHVFGLDLAVALRIGAALGYDEHALARLLPAAESGYLAGIAEQDKN